MVRSNPFSPGVPVSHDLPPPTQDDAPSLPHDDDRPEVVAAHARAGLGLFAVYLALYAGFMGLSAFGPDVMARTTWIGLNVAIVYGMGLIFAAVILAFVYMAACRRIAGQHAHTARGRDH
jgi:uncharacterized membrane protein (DUF485 family)